MVPCDAFQRKDAKVQSKVWCAVHCVLGAVMQARFLGLNLVFPRSHERGYEVRRRMPVHGRRSTRAGCRWLGGSGSTPTHFGRRGSRPSSGNEIDVDAVVRRRIKKGYWVFGVLRRAARCWVRFSTCVSFRI